MYRLYCFRRNKINWQFRQEAVSTNESHPTTCEDCLLPEFELLDACRQGNIEALHRALKRGASVASSPLGVSCLRLAGNSGHLEAARILLARGADPNERFGKRARSILHSAVESSNFGFASLLLDYGADPNALDYRHRTPLHIACTRTNAFLVRRLLDARADRSALDSNGNTPLHFAAAAGSVEICKMLIKHDANLNAINRKGMTPMHLAKRANHTSVISLLLDARADPLISPMSQSYFDFSATDDSPIPNFREMVADDDRNQESRKR